MSGSSHKMGKRMKKTYDFPMTIEEAEIIYDSLSELQSTFYIGYAKHFSVEKKDSIINLVETLGNWIQNRSEE